MKMGLRWGEACALSNLATFKTKLGALSEAERLFRQAKTTAKTYPGNRGGILHGIEGEEGPFKAVLGDYRQALAQLIRAARCRLLFQNERLQFQISLCNVLIDLGRTRAATRLLGRIHQATHGSRLNVVQFAFVASRTEKDPAVAAGLLREAITIAHDSKLIYEECKLKLEYCRRTITGNLPDTCSAELLDAESIAKANGYIPQQIDALVLRGALAPSLIISKELYSEAFLLSRHHGSSLVQAYIAYALANTLECGSQFVPARRWYLRSCSLISRITEGVSGSLKRSFLRSHKWASACLGKIRKSAVATDNPRFDLPSELTGKASIYFRTLHEISELSRLKDSPLEFFSEVANIIARLTTWDAFVIEYGNPDPQIKKCIGKSGRHSTESVAFIGIDSAQHFDHLPWRRRDSMWLPCGSHTPRVGLYLKFKKAASETDGQFLSVLQRVLEEGLSTVGAKTSFVDRAADARWGDLVGSSDAFAQLCKEILRASAHAANVLIQGETGTGKELVAKAIHDRSHRRIKRFVPVDCGAIPDGLFESEIFGIRRGSFTGSDRDRKGLAEEADGGTLFLDEIANLSLQSQAKLLRFVQEKAIRRLGSTAEHALDVRILAASNVALSQLVREGKFREDLYFRLGTVVIHVPPLSSRTSDVVPLAEHFLHSLNAQNKTNKSFSVKTLSELSRRHFPGNVRELRNLVERCFYSSDTRILELPGEAREQQLRNIEGWFREVTTGNRSFWSSIYVDYRQRRISRQDMRSLIDHGLRVTNGYYKALAKRFNITVSEYRRFMDFLRRNDCLLDFRPYRRS
jgi:DNA-binding NtrC family response regulator